MHFKNIASTIFLGFLITFSSLSCVSAASTFNAKVATSGSLIVRSGPAKEYRQVDQLPSGQVVTVYEQKNGWFRIGTNRWVAGQYLKTTTAKASAVATVTKASASFTAFNAATTNVLNVRSGPGTTYKKVSQLSTGKVIKVLEQKSGWSRIATNQWVMTQYLKKTTLKPVSAVASVKIAKPTTQIAAVSPSPSAPASPTSLSASCLAAIKRANSYCSSVARGCISTSKTPKCLAANQKCEAQQESALATCPQK